MKTSKLIPAGLTILTGLYFGCQSTSSVATPETRIITIKNMAFTPSSLNIHSGDTILFKNEDMVTHNITNANKNAWASGPLPAGSSWKTVVTASADYFCSLHPVMKGKLVVE